MDTVALSIMTTLTDFHATAPLPVGTSWMESKNVISAKRAEANYWRELLVSRRNETPLVYLVTFQNGAVHVFAVSGNSELFQFGIDRSVIRSI